MDDDGLFAIEVDADDYAETAAGDTPSVPRTFQSEADFQAVKASYRAKIDNGNLYAELIQIVPALGDGAEVAEKVKLNKRETQLLGYAVGEMYFEKQYEEILRLVQRVLERCVLDKKMEEALGRWKGRCEGRIKGEKEEVGDSG